MNNEFVMVPRELRSVLSMILNALDRDASEGKAARGEMAEELRAILGRPSEQPQGEPVALPERKEPLRVVGSAYDDGLCEGYNECLDEIAKLWPLFTHADPGEVERYEGELKRLRVDAATLAGTVEGLRAQLAEAHAVLRLIPRRSTPYDSKIDAVLSASAEPSAMAERIKSAACPECASKPCMCAELIAPAVIDERAEFEAWGTDRGYFNLKREHSGKYKFHTAWAAWEGWQARAALERKP